MEEGGDWDWADPNKNGVAKALGLSSPGGSSSSGGSVSVPDAPVTKFVEKCDDPGYKFIDEPSTFVDSCSELTKLNNDGKQDCFDTADIAYKTKTFENVLEVKNGTSEISSQVIDLAKQTFYNNDFTTYQYGGVNISNPLAYDTVRDNVKKISTKCMDLRSKIYIPTDKVYKIFPDKYKEALNKYQSVMHTYLYTTTIDETKDTIKNWEQDLISYFERSTKGGRYDDVSQNLFEFINYDFFPNNCDNDDSRLDSDGIYKCFGNVDTTNSLLNQVKDSCNKALDIIYKTNDEANIPGVFNKCSQFFRNNLANTVKQVSNNIHRIISENTNIYNMDLAGMNLVNNKKCPVDSHVATPVLGDAEAAIKVHNDNMLPKLDALIKKLTQIKDSLPNFLIIDDPIIGPPSSNPFIKISSNYIFKKENDEKNGKYAQNITFTIPRGKTGKIGPPGNSSLPGQPGDQSITGISGNMGVWELPIQYQGIF